ncbi:MAG: amino acid adenylation domain-containing protein, partial [bacterium]|nr:amino acid adenylation domain-containing protein [bacterium]
ETTLAKTCYFIQPLDIRRERIPVGTPLPGARVVVLDENLEPCDQLVTGELYIKTPFRTAGYCNDPGLNTERFIPDPFKDSIAKFDDGDDDFDNRLHKTGDQGRILADGNIDVLGRNDRQVKIRGIRVELEEIENILVKHPMVIEAAAVKKETSPGNELLCAYLTGTVESEVIKEYISKKL